MYALNITSEDNPVTQTSLPFSRGELDGTRTMILWCDISGSPESPAYFKRDEMTIFPMRKNTLWKTRPARIRTTACSDVTYSTSVNDSRIEQYKEPRRSNIPISTGPRTPLHTAFFRTCEWMGKSSSTQCHDWLYPSGF